MAPFLHVWFVRWSGRLFFVLGPTIQGFRVVDFSPEVVASSPFQRTESGPQLRELQATLRLEAQNEDTRAFLEPRGEGETPFQTKRPYGVWLRDNFPTYLFLVFGRLKRSYFFCALLTIGSYFFQIRVRRYV